MGKFAVDDVWGEIKNRLDSLIEMESFFGKHKVALYGTGLNAERILNALSINIVGLIDSSKTGKYVYGKRVLSLLEAELLGVDIIIIATEPDTAKIIYKRIAAECQARHIMLYDMYGKNMFDMHSSLIKKEIEYSQVNATSFENYINKYQTVFIPLIGCVAEKIKSDYEIMEDVNERLKDCEIECSEYLVRRKQAQERIPLGDGRSIDDVYELMQGCMSCEYDLNSIKKIEKELYLKNLVAKKDVIELLKKRFNKGENVYVFSSMYIGMDVIRSFLNNNGLDDINLVCTDSSTYINIIIRYVRAAIEYLGIENIGFIGTHDEAIIPCLFDMDYFLLKSGEEIYREFLVIDSQDGFTDLNQKSDFLRKFNSPFFKFDSYSYFVDNEDLFEKGKMNFLELLDCKNVNYDSFVLPECDSPLVSIVIPAYNQFDYTINCIRSIKLNTGKIKYEVILADDCSTDNTIHIEKYIKNLKVIRSTTQKGFLNNCNDAARSANGEYILFLNNDTQVQPGWLTSLLKILKSDNNCGMVGSKLVFPDGTLQEAGGIIWNDASGMNYGNGYNPNAFDFNYVREVDYISGAAILVRKKVWDVVGGFDKRYAPAYCEDSDLAFMIRQHGWSVKYQPESIVVHYGSVTYGKKLNSKQHKLIEKNQKIFYQKWKSVLLKEQYAKKKQLIAACERKQKKKTVLFISEFVPEFDKDAGSKTIWFYIKEFLKRGYIVKLMVETKNIVEPYTTYYRRLGVEVISGGFIYEKKSKWILYNKESIDYAFLNYPNCSFKYIDLLKELKIPTRYYGHDLHYVRLQRQYDMTGDANLIALSEEYKRKEEYLIKHSDAVYYPSDVEISIIKNVMNRSDVKRLPIQIYKIEEITNCYSSIKRKGIMFIGGYRHLPNVDAILWFVNEIYSNVKRKTDAELFIAGSNMPSEIANINMKGIHILGKLTEEELKQMYDSVRMIIVPLRYGAGIKGKVIEAMFHGIPVVSTSIGMEGIPLVETRKMIANKADEFANLINDTYNNFDLLDAVSKEETDIIRNNYSEQIAWDTIASDFS